MITAPAIIVDRPNLGGFPSIRPRSRTMKSAAAEKTNTMKFSNWGLMISASIISTTINSHVER